MSESYGFNDFLDSIGTFIGGSDGVQLNDILGTISGLAGGYEAIKGTEDQVTKPFLWAGQEDAMGNYIQTVQDKYDMGPNEYYPGQTVADWDPNQLAGQNDWLASTDRMQNMADTSGSAAMTLAGGGVGQVGGFNLQDQIGFGIPEEYQNAIMNPVMDQLNNQIIPGLHTAATAQGAFGGSRMQQQKADAAEQATEAATNAMIRGNLDARGQSIGQRAGDISAQLTGRQQDIYQNQMMNDAMRAGISSIGTAMGQQLIPGQVMQDVGNLRQMYDQSLIDADKARFDWNRAESENHLNRLGQRLQGQPTGGEIIEGQDGGWMDALSGFMTGTNIFDEIFGQNTSGIGSGGGSSTTQGPMGPTNQF